MANFFVDSTTGDNGDDGTTMDLAWATVEYAIENDFDDGSIVWIRRGHSETPGSDILAAGGGVASAPKYFIGWPRAADATITEADWTNGSTTVDTIVGLGMVREQHLGRYITAPDGATYMITKITDGDTIIIDREYAGPTVTTTDGACTIHADEDWVDDMGTEYGFDDSLWAIQEADWDADADDLPLIDWDEGVFQCYHYYDDYYIYRNLEFKDWGDGNGGFRLQRSHIIGFQGCLYSSILNVTSIRLEQGDVRVDRCIFTANTTGTAQASIAALVGGRVFMSNSAAYDLGGSGIVSQGGYVELDNVNLGIEGNCAVADISVYDGGGTIRGKNVSMGAATKRRAMTRAHWATISIENYNKVLGANILFNNLGTVTKLDVVAGSGDPFKRPGGADSVAEVLYDRTESSKGAVEFFLMPIFEHEFEATTDTKNYRYYVNAEEAVAADELWIEVEYVSVYDDATEHVFKKVVSTGRQ